MEEDDDMFAAPSEVSGPSEPANNALFQVLNVDSGTVGVSKVKDEEEAREEAARQRLAKADRANQQLAHHLHDRDQKRADLYDEKDRADFEDDVDNILDVTDMGEDAKRRGAGGRNAANKKGAKDEYNDILEGERIEPLNMKDELRRGEIGVYGEMRKKKRRGEMDEDDPSELLMPETGANGSVKKQKDRRKEQRKKRRRLATGESDDSDSDSGPDHDADDAEENEELNAEDPWLASIANAEESSIYHGQKNHSKSSKSKSGSLGDEESERPEYLKDQTKALQELQSLLKEGPAGENVLRLIKRLSPSSNRSSSSNNRSSSSNNQTSSSNNQSSSNNSSSSSSNKKAKLSENDLPHSTSEDGEKTNLDVNTHNMDVSSRNDIVLARKEAFDKAVAIADFLMDAGYTTVYDATYEDISHRLNPTKSSNSKNHAETPQTVDEMEQGQEGVFWQYKWSLDASEIFGPFDTDSIKSWAPSFLQYPTMVIRGGASPSAVSKRPSSDGWVTFEPFFWS